MNLETPSQILSELANKYGKELKCIFTTFREPSGLRFKCILACFGKIEEGIGISKSTAKNCAARKLLNGIDVEKDFVKVQKIHVNYVGQLLEFCDKMKLPIPEYNLRRHSHETESKTFIMECIVYNYSTKAADLSKQAAKHKAAKRMLDILTVDFDKDLGATDFPILEAQHSQDECKLNKALLPCELSKSAGNCLIDTTYNPSDRNSNSTLNVNYVGRLQELCNKLNYTHPLYTTIEETCKPMNYVIQCTVSKFTAVGSDKLKKLAKQTAAMHMLEMLEKIKIDRNISYNRSFMPEKINTKPEIVENIDIIEGLPKENKSSEPEICLERLSISDPHEISNIDEVD